MFRTTLSILCTSGNQTKGDKERNGKERKNETLEESKEENVIFTMHFNTHHYS